ncbi:MAG: hypothetical protein ABL958_03985 [Bdellovibrionia bacterium]
MAHIGKNFVFAMASIMFISSSGVASLDTNVFDLEMKRFETIEHRAYEKMSPCDKLEDDIEYRDCLVDAAVYALSARDSKNDGVSKVFDNIFSKIDEALKPGAALLIAQKAVEGFKASTLTNERATYYEILKNLMDNLPSGKEDFNLVYEYIKDNKFEIPEDVSNARMNRMGLKTENLGEKAEIMLGKRQVTAKAAAPINAIEVSE